MLADRELEESASQLGAFREANAQHHDTLEQVLEKFSTLVEDYKRLKSDYEEERDSRERYKQLARGQERNPFVLVLIDGDGYVFNDDLVSNGAEGGQRAASLLNDAVKRSLRARGLEDCRVMVRVYANLAGLSKALAKAHLAGPEKRSLAPFTANFTRSNDLFDYIDAGELKEGSDFKIRALFRQFVDSAQCKHIYFAGCHDVGYINELTQYAANKDRITLVKGPPMHHQFTRLGMQIEDFPGVFRTVPLDIFPPGPSVAATAPLTPPPSVYTNTNSDAKICAFFMKGQCKYGKNCKFLHTRSKTNNGADLSASNGTKFEDIRNWREEKSDVRAAVPSQMSSLAQTDKEFFKANNSVAGASFASLAEPVNAEGRARVSTGLRKPPEGFIAVNEDQQRIDPDIPQPSQSDFDDFTRRTARRKLCNSHFIGGHCPEGDHCRYDHTPAPEGVINALKQVVFSNPCPRKGACRRSICLYGHICQKADCTRRGGKSWCKFGRHVHNMDLTPSSFVPAELPPQNRVNESASSFISATSKAEEPSKKSLTQEHDDWASSHSRSSSQPLSEAQYQASDIETSQSPGGASQLHGSHQGGLGDGAQDSDNAASSSTNIGGANLHNVNGNSESGARDRNYGNVQDSVPRLHAATGDWRAHPVVPLSRPAGSASFNGGNDGGVPVKPGDGKHAGATELKTRPLALSEDWNARWHGLFGRS
ncbi:zinc finger protein [Teratosphaeria destructans]|uniref:Zinc finger protein n=1 Tax=Teratosphaeria destructans TaxID=418781 RepID=A0A9W7W070_9PEZI|nr:zinc finger protein [Teratosphaeria destructans]